VRSFFFLSFVLKGSTLTLLRSWRSLNQGMVGDRSTSLLTGYADSQQKGDPAGAGPFSVLLIVGLLTYTVTLV
jgi:hypothetical protein